MPKKNVRPDGRRPQAERSAEMKKRLLDAAFEVLRDNGFTDFASAEVAKRAGVTRGAIIHHFPNKNDLLEATMEHVFREALSKSVNLANSVKRVQEPVVAIINDASSFYFSDYFYVALDMAMSTAKDPDFKLRSRSLIRNYREKTEDEWIDVLVDQGWAKEKADDIVWMTVALLRGAAIRALWRNEPEKIKRAMKIWSELAKSYLGKSASP